MVIVVISTTNTSSSLENNHKIVLATLVFILSSTYLGRLKGSLGRTSIVLSGAMISWMLISNCLAIYMGIEPARWSRISDNTVQIVSTLTLASALRHRPEIVLTLIYGVLIAFAVNTLLLIWTWSTLEAPQSYNWIWEFPNFVNIRFFASFMMVVACVSLWGFLFYNQKFRLLFSLTFLLSLAQVFWSGSRSPVLSLLVASVILYIVSGPAYRKKWFQLFILAALATLLAAQFPVDSNQLGVERALGFGNKALNSTDSIDELSSGRLELWRDALHWIMQKPVLGWGGDYYREISMHSYIAQVHNGPLQIAIEWGIPLSLFVYSFFAFSVLQYSLFFYKEKSTSITFSLGYFLFITMLAHSLLDGVFYHGAMLFFIMMAMALLISEQPLHPNILKQPQPRHTIKH